MAEYTPNLNLFKKDPVADKDTTFNIQTMLNDNWDKLDSAVKAALDDIGDLQDGQVRIATGSYVGTGTYGSSNPCSLTFDFIPRFVAINDNSGGSTASFSTTILWFGQIGNYEELEFSLSNTTFSWYKWYGSNPGDQLNADGTTYRYLAIG